jgi:hypothetical protein
MLLMQTPARAVFRSVNETLTTTVNKPVGLAVGDLLVVLMYNGGTISTASGAAWHTTNRAVTTIGTPTNYSFSWKIADAADVANVISTTAGGAVAASYYGRGTLLTGLVSKAPFDTGSPSSATVVIPGFTPTVATRGAICLFVDEAEFLTPTIGANFTRRLINNTNGSCTAQFCDLLTPSSVSGATSWANNGTIGKFGDLLEVV